jgi:hypothetical protein
LLPGRGLSHITHLVCEAQESIVFHLIGALSEFGKLGILSIARSAERAYASYLKSGEILDCESALPA